ncbi:radical SAM protein [Ruminococcaceae bacterium OttesenSCG-928-D13]|nr:radical SAM protein [Ruminococcaceae bacterium OttesenSCG-928-D13]
MSIQEPQWDAQFQDAADWEALETTMAARAALKHQPLGATFELTPFCNLRCKMCYVRLEKEQAVKIGRMLTADEWISLADDTLKAGTLNLLLTGGEPLSRPDFAEIYTALSDRPFVLSLNTNAALMDAETQALFCKRPPSSIAVTLYGACPETYGKICGDPGAFERTLRGLEMLAEVPTSLEVRTTFIQDNMHELDALREIAARYTKRFAINVNVFKPIRGATADVESCRLTARQAMDLDTAHRQYYKARQKSGLSPKEPATTPKKGKYTGFDLPPKVLTCMAAKGMYWLSWDGRMLPCGTFSHPYTQPLKEGFDAAWQRLPTLYEDLRLPEKCEHCEIDLLGCPNCPANIQAESGNFTDVPPYICALAKERAQRLGNLKTGSTRHHTE